MSLWLDHVAVLVRSLERASKVVGDFGLSPGMPQEFESEGTRECYVGAPGNTARLLLVEAIGPGPYERALQKRGPGLHHLSVHTESLDRELRKFLAQGWKVHPATKVPKPWLSCKGFPFLIEFEEANRGGTVPLIRSVKVRVPGKMIELDGILENSHDPSVLTFENGELPVGELLN